MKSKPASVAGLFYPENPDELMDTMARWLLAEKSVEEYPRAIIVPHSAYQFSGEIAARAYSSLRHRSDTFRRVILIGSADKYNINGCAIPSHDAFSTPIGDVSIDRSLIQLARSHPWIEENDLVHLMEHSLEVQLPFLQLCLPHFSILPILVGNIRSSDLLSVFEYLPLGDDVLYVLSTELSCSVVDRGTCDVDEAAIQSLIFNQENQHHRSTCGTNIMRVFLQFCQQNCWKTELARFGMSHDCESREIPENFTTYASFIAHRELPF